MFFKKKSNSRLYYPTRSTWHRKKRQRPIKLNRGKGIFSRIYAAIKKLFHRSVLALSVAAISLFFILIIGFSTFFSITQLKIVRESFHVDSSLILQELKPFLGRNLLFFPRREAVEAIQKKFPEFSSVRVSKSIPGLLVIRLENYPIVANLRAYSLPPAPEAGPAKPEENAENPSEMPQDALKTAFGIAEELQKNPQPLELIEQKGLLNQNGQVLFDQEENLELLTITVENLPQPLVDREAIIPPEHMKLVLAILDYFKANFNLGISKLSYLPSAREIHLITSDKDMIIWISLDRDYKKQLDKLTLVYQEAGLDKEDIAYIDLRVNDKVIYCPRAEKCDQ